LSEFAQRPVRLRTERIKVFCFFFSKKKRLLAFAWFLIDRHFALPVGIGGAFVWESIRR
jgi:hypothetical protein